MQRGDVVETKVFDPGVDYDEACAVVRWCSGRAVEEGMEISTPEGTILALPGDPIERYADGTFDIARDTLGEHPCSNCGATECLDGINRTGAHCCSACAFGAHERPII
jgi:hypothetical protein